MNTNLLFLYLLEDYTNLVEITNSVNMEDPLSGAATIRFWYRLHNRLWTSIYGSSFSSHVNVFTWFGLDSIYGVNFQDSATTFCEALVDLHQLIMYYLIFLCVIVCYLLFRFVSLFSWDALFSAPISLRIILFPYQFMESYNDIPNVDLFDDMEMLMVTGYRLLFENPVSELSAIASNFNDMWANISEDTLMELILTIVPVIILFFIGVPSLLLLYSLDEVENPDLTIEVQGNQWYWVYSYFSTLFFPWWHQLEMSHNIFRPEYFSGPECFSAENQYETTLGWPMPSLLDLYPYLRLPMRSHIRALVFSNDVIHSWAVPAFGINVDAIPGRINQAIFFPKREGIFFGQCSELCGVYHGFMPIGIQILEANRLLFTGFFSSSRL